MPPRPEWLLPTVPIFVVSTAALYAAYELRGGMGIVNVVVSGAGIVVVLLVGMLAFNERLSPWEWLGTVCIVIGFLVISLLGRR